MMNCTGRKPVIGIVPLWDEKKDSLWMLPGYMDGISQAGGLPFMLPLTEDITEIKQLVSMCDGILFTGGHDVSPKLYHEEKLAICGECCKRRDDMEALLLKEALQADKAILGICRGIQFINAALGGSLYQDIPAQLPSGVEHHQPAPYDVPSHEVTLLQDTPLYELLQKDSISVNSCHHQALKALSPELTAMAAAPDGIVEAVYMPGRRFVWAVQWHPEFAFRADENSRKIFQAFVDAML